MFETIFFVVPILSFVLFGISLFRFLWAKRKNRQTPGAFSPQEMKTLKRWLIVTSIAAGIFGAVFFGFLGLMFMAVAFM